MAKRAGIERRPFLFDPLTAGLFECHVERAARDLSDAGAVQRRKISHGVYPEYSEGFEMTCDFYRSLIRFRDFLGKRE
jgi:hypothetical protein